MNTVSKGYLSQWGAEVVEMTFLRTAVRVGTMEGYSNNSNRGAQSV